MLEGSDGHHAAPCRSSLMSFCLMCRASKERVGPVRCGISSIHETATSVASVQSLIYSSNESNKLRVRTHILVYTWHGQYLSKLAVGDGFETAVSRHARTPSFRRCLALLTTYCCSDTRRAPKYLAPTYQTSATNGSSKQADAMSLLLYSQHFAVPTRPQNDTSSPDTRLG